MFKDFGRRIQRDLKRSVEARTLGAERAVEVNVMSHPMQRYAVWFGGSVLGMSPGEWGRGGRLRRLVGLTAGAAALARDIGAGLCAPTRRAAAPLVSSRPCTALTPTLLQFPCLFLTACLPGQVRAPCSPNLPLPSTHEHLPWSLTGFKDIVHTREQYFECGPGIVRNNPVFR